MPDTRYLNLVSGCFSGMAGLGLIGFVLAGGVGDDFHHKSVLPRRLRWFWGFWDWVCFAHKKYEVWLC